MADLAHPRGGIVWSRGNLAGVPDVFAHGSGADGYVDTEQAEQQDDEDQADDQPDPAGNVHGYSQEVALVTSTTSPTLVEPSALDATPGAAGPAMIALVSLSRWAATSGRGTTWPCTYRLQPTCTAARTSAARPTTLIGRKTASAEPPSSTPRRASTLFMMRTGLVFTGVLLSRPA